MKIRAVVDRARARNWQKRAIEDLRARGHDVRISINAGQCHLPAAIASLLTLERVVYGGGDAPYGGFWKGPAADEPSGFQPDLVLDFTCFVRDPGPVRTLRPIYCGSVMEEAGHMALLNGASPVLGISDSAFPDLVREYHVAIEDPFKLGQAMDYVGARLGKFIVRAVTEVKDGAPLADATPVSGASAFLGWSNRQALAALSARAAATIERLTTRAPRWHVGWRRTNCGGVAQSLEIPAGGWVRLPDDGRRYYADPFAVNRDGRDWLFVEEFPYATGKGFLSAVEVGANGPMGAPKPVLELPHHLSYPFVFEDGGQVWMIPESCAARRVELYRATNFPWSWELAHVLIADEEVSDATVVQHNGRYWLFGTVSGGWQSSWDTLKIWTADALQGPWRPCGDGPALVDARCARPAGRFFKRGGELWRPAQDCSTGYGAGLVLARVDRLDTDGFAQTTGAVLRPNQAWPGIGIHTVNMENGLEVVDGCTA
jgi:hypothetical protein